jgi:nucleoside-diphosphate-sugar epimerase
MLEAQGRIEVVQGSIDDPAVLARALTGADTLFWCVPQGNQQTDVLEYYLAFTRPLAKALKDQRVERVVAVSSGGRGRAKNAGPISALHAMEEPRRYVRRDRRGHLQRGTAYGGDDDTDDIQAMVRDHVDARNCTESDRLTRGVSDG